MARYGGGTKHVLFDLAQYLTSKAGTYSSLEIPARTRLPAKPETAPDENFSPFRRGSLRWIRGGEDERYEVYRK